MGFAAVARVTEGTWVACAVQDGIGFGLKPGGRLDVNTTLCVESRASRQPIVIDHASEDAKYCSHHTPRLYRIESYISVPIVRPNGDYFGNLCAIDPKPAQISNERTVAMFELFAELISAQLEREEQQAATQSALLNERATAELREQFIAVLGHDLRNPLSSVVTAAHLLITRSADAEDKALGERIKAAGMRMSRLIQDVMDFARARMGSGMGVSVAPVADLEAALRDVVAELSGTKPGHSIVDRISIREPVFCDRGRMQQLLSNLLGNALTYGAPNEPVIMSAGIAGDSFELSVSNKGEPIAPANLAKVFEPYWRQSTNQKDGGLGLGLHICEQIVQAHGGTLTVTSTAESGTCFTARLPRNKRAPAATAN
jgi:signal transduction histidine kinase